MEFDNGSWDDEPVHDTYYHGDNDKDVRAMHIQSAANFNELNQKINVPPEYKRLISVYGGKPKGGPKEAIKVEDEKFRGLRLSEQGLEKAAGSHQPDVVRPYLIFLSFLALWVMKKKRRLWGIRTCVITY